jgi:ABC-type nitrate/sulfonate/bicarbonate transport system ATPase subunit
MNQYSIEIDQISHSFRNGTQALNNVSLAVPTGQVVSLVGPSGCGKSTLLNIVAGLIRPTSGEIRVGGSSVSDRRGSFGYMPQTDGLLPWRDAVGNAALLAEISGTPRMEARTRAQSLLRDFGLGEFARRRPAELSGGMRQRVALIRTMLPDRDVLMDEPFGALDAITRSELQEWFMELQTRTGLSTLLVTHDVEEALLLSDRVYVMSARPGTIQSVHDVRFARPRGVMLTATMEFAVLKGALLTSLRSSVSHRSGFGA